MSNPYDPNYGPRHAPPARANAMLHLVELPDGAVKVTVLHDPPLDPDPAHVPNSVELLVDKLLRAALDSGAKEA